MSMLSLLTRLKQTGITLHPDGGNLKIKAPKGTLTPAMVEEIKEHKEEILRYMQTVQAQPGYESIGPVEKKEYYPLSSAQKRLFFLQQYEDNSTFYNMPYVIPWGGEIETGKLAEIFKRLIARHESLRTSFAIIGEGPVQRVHDQVEFRVEYCPGRGEVSSFIRPFDLATAPLLRVGRTAAGPGPGLLLVDLHHIIGDGVSEDILAGDFVALSREAELPPLKLHYKDYAEWQNHRRQQESTKSRQTYWKDRLAGELPVLQLPTDFPRPGKQSFEGDTQSFTLEAEETGQVKRLAQETEATVYMIVLAMFNILLSKLANQEDIIVGTPVAGRQHPDLEGIIGMFVNTLPMRNYPEGEKTVKTFLEEVKANTLSAYENQAYPFDEMVEQLSVSRDTGRNPVFDVMCNFLEPGENPPGKIALEEQNQSEFIYRNPIAKFDLTLTVMDRGEKLECEMEYCTRLFKESTIRGMIEYFKRIIRQVPGGDRRIAGIDILSPEEKKRLLEENNQTCSGYPRDKTIHRVFEEQEERTPDRVALEGPELQSGVRPVTLTYREIREQTGRLAGRLKERGVGPDIIVGIMMERSVEMVIGILGILKAGGAYLPIDPGNPQERVDYMLKDSGTKTLLTANEIASFSTESAVTPEAFLNPSEGRPFTTHHSSFIIHNSGNLAYVIYTSGTTGKPKGTLIEHTNVVNILFHLERLYPLGEQGVYLLKTNYIFDVSVTELFGWFFGGGRLAIVERGAWKDPGKIVEAVGRYAVTHINFVPAVFTAFVEGIEPPGINWLSTLRYIFLAGEELLSPIVRRFGISAPRIAMENLYGPTEATIYATGYSLADWDGTGKIPIGKPLPNVKVYILDKNGGLQPRGVPGELTISGQGIARGYLNRPELTAEKFIMPSATRGSFEKPPLDPVKLLFNYHSPFTTHHSPFTIHHSPLYRTGDLSRWRPDGTIEFLGRKDDQVKIRGLRVELKEIESRLLSHEHVVEAVVMARERPAVKENPGETEDKYLCAYIVTDAEVTEAQLKDELSRYMPDYMIPAYFIYQERIPLTPNGKVDRKALPEPGIKAGPGYEPPRNPRERKLVEIWAEILRMKAEDIGIDTNFFQVGGQSLKATVMVTAIYKELNIKLSLDEVFKTPTIRKLAEKVKGLTMDKYESIRPVEEKEYYSLSSIQKRLYILQQMDNKSTAYNLPGVTVLEEIDKKRLETAFGKLIERHEALRTSFEMLNDEPVQVINKTVEFAVENSREGNRGGPGAFLEQFSRPFDLSKAPLLHVALEKTGETRYLLMTDIHHIIADGASGEILTAEFQALYTGRELPPLKLHFKDYVEWQNRPQMQAAINRQEDYWLKEMAGEIPLLKMPVDFERPPVQSFEGSTIRFTVGGPESQALNDLAIKENATLYMVLFTIYNVLLSKLSGQEEIIVGMVISGRRHPDIQEIIGMFVNTAAVRTFPAKEKTFREFLREVREKMLRAYENRDYPLENLVEKILPAASRSRNPLFDTVFNSGDAAIGRQNNREVRTKTPGIKANPYEYETKTTKFDIASFCSEVGKEIEISMDYSTKLFKRTTMERFIGYYREIVTQVVGDNEIELKDIRITHHLLSAKSTPREMELGF